MLYKWEELTPLYNEYLKNKTHSWKPYTKVWFWNLLLRVNKAEDIWSRERDGQPKVKRTIFVKKPIFNLFEETLKETKNIKFAETTSWISHYIYNKCLEDESRII